MAAANLETIQNSNNVADVVTIQSTSTNYYVVTGGICGTLTNIGSATVYVTTNSQTVAAVDGTQRIGTIPLIANMTIQLPKTVTQFAHKCAGSDTTTLVFAPIYLPE